MVATLLPTIRIIVPDQNFEDDQIGALIPKADDPIYQTLQIKIGNKILEPASFNQPGYLTNIIEPLGKTFRIIDSLNAVCDDSVDVICCANGDYPIPANSTVPFQLFEQKLKDFQVQVQKVNEERVKQKRIVRLLGYGLFENLFPMFKKQFNNCIQCSALSLDPMDTCPMSTLMASVGKVKKIANDISAILAELYAKRAMLGGKIESLEELVDKLTSSLDSISNQIHDVENKLASTEAEKFEKKKELEKLVEEQERLLKDLEEVEDQLSKGQTELGKIAKELQELQEKRDFFKDKKSRDINRLKKFISDADASRAKCEKIAEEADNQIKVIEELIKAKENVELDLAKKISEATEAIKDYKSQIKSSLEKHSDVTKEIANLDKSEVSYKKMLSELKNKKVEVENELRLQTLELNKKAAQFEKTNQKIQMKSIKLDDLPVPSVLLPQIEELLNLTEDSGPKKSISIPSCITLEPNGLEEFVKILIIHSDKIDKLEVGPVVVPNIKSFTDYLRQPDIALVSLNLSGANLEDKDAVLLLAALRDNPGVLQDLNLKNNKLSKQSAILLADFITKSNSIKIINLNNNQLGNDGLEELSIGIQLTKSLRSIDLNENHIGAPGWQAWANAITANSQWKNCWISFPKKNPVKAEGIASLEKVFLAEWVLGISLRNCEIDDEALVKLCEILQKRSDSKVYLDLGLASKESNAVGISYYSYDHLNQVGKQGLEALAELVNKRPQLFRSIELNGGLSASGIEHFPIFFQQVSPLVPVSLENIGLTMVSLMKILPILEARNETSLDFSNNYFGNDGLLKLCQYLENSASYCKKITSLHLWHCGCRELEPLVQLMSAGKLEKLVSLNLVGNGLNDTQLEKIANALSSMPKPPTSIDLSGNPFTVNGLSILLDKVQISGISVQFTVYRTSLVAEDAQTIFDKFPQDVLKKLSIEDHNSPFCAKLKFLLEGVQIKNGVCDLSKRQMNDNFITRVIDALITSGTPLKQLNLRHNKISELGLSKLIDQYFLQDESRIAELNILDLSENPLSDASSNTLLALLTHPKCAVKQIYLNSVGMSAAGLNPLLIQIHQLKTLESIAVAGNNLKGLFQIESSPGPTKIKVDIFSH